MKNQQLDLFGVDDTPLFSGTPARVERDDYQPVKSDEPAPQLELIEAHGRTLEVERSHHKITITPTDSNYFVYRAQPLRTILVGTFEKMPKAHAFAKDCSITTNEDVYSVVNANGVTVGKYRLGKYYI